MNINEIQGHVEAQFQDGDRTPCTVQTIQEAIREGADAHVHLDDIRMACGALCVTEMIEEVAEDTYACTAAYAAQVAQHDREFFAQAVADHVIKQAARK